MKKSQNQNGKQDCVLNCSIKIYIFLVHKKDKKLYHLNRIINQIETGIQIPISIHFHQLLTGVSFDSDLLVRVEFTF